MHGNYFRQVFTIDNIFVCLLIVTLINFIKQGALQRTRLSAFALWILTKNIVSHLWSVYLSKFQFQSDICHYILIWKPHSYNNLESAKKKNQSGELEGVLAATMYLYRITIINSNSFQH